jgi:ketosteroid isomerase-like protein
MSQENVERLRQIYAAINDGDDEPLLDFLHPDFVYRTREELPGGGSYSAADLLSRLAELREIFRATRFDPEEFINCDKGVVVLVRGTGTGRVGGVPIDEHLFHVWKIEDAKARALCTYSNRAEALEAVGLSEQDAHTDS